MKFFLDEIFLKDLKYLVMLQLPIDHFVLHPFYQLAVLAGTPSKISPEFGKEEELNVQGLSPRFRSVQFVIFEILGEMSVSI